MTISIPLKQAETLADHVLTCMQPSIMYTPTALLLVCHEHWSRKSV